ncbi:MAG TPA: CHAD domain-containing protein [Candidatus Acidoferrum sp.]|nr:CHAD domain-containing protein [Candidatus Acidoferrum sp.]
MAVIVPLPAGPVPEPRGPFFWMQRVLRELENLRESPAPDTVHDLRVALRRCRSMAATMEEVDPHPAWEEMRQEGRKLFRKLGALRDAQVQEDLVKKLAPENDRLRALLLGHMEAREKTSREEALRSASRFDEKKWKSLARTLRSRAQLVPPGGTAAECLALERFEEARELHRRALRTERPKPWHKLRIGVKKFRYTVEGFLPEHHAAWSGDLKRVQDLLGDIHDLDVLHAMVKEQGDASLAEDRGVWEENIAHERHERIETYRQLTLGTVSLWNRWQIGLPTNGQIQAAAMARIQATARAADPHHRRTTRDASLARGIAEAFRRAKVSTIFAEADFRRLLGASAKLHGIQPNGAEKSRPKAARRFLASLPTPPGWGNEDWSMVSFAVRYHRGAEPKADRGAISKMGAQQQVKIHLLAGLLRLARALRKAGMISSKGMRASASGEAIVLTAPNLQDTPEVSARLASAKHLLEKGLGKPLLIKAVPLVEKVVTLTKAPDEPAFAAVASD